jgi:hypothetical protein
LDANYRVGQADGSLILQGGRRSQFQSLIVRADSSFYYDADAKAPIALPTREIHSVVTHNHFEGAVDGALLGAVGLAAIVMLDLNVNRKGGEELGLGGAFAVTESALLGGGVGLIIGAIIGDTHTFIFPSDTTQTHTEVP